MQHFSLSVLDDAGSFKTKDALASELCNAFYLRMSDHGDRIDPEEYKRSREMFVEFAETILQQATHEDPNFTIGMQPMSEED